MMSTLRTLFERRIRGFRIVELAAVGCLAVLVLGVYAFKAGAGRESAKISDVDKEIAEERRHVRLLRAELAHLEQPARLERLSTAYLGLSPVDAKREAPADALSELARQPAAPPVAPKPAPATEAAPR